MSARAAAQLELLGFQDVRHYTEGKADWMVRGLEMEPAPAWRERMRALPYFVNNLAPWIRASWIRISSRVTAAEFTRDDLPRLLPEQPIAELPPRAGVLAVVLNQTGGLLGAVEKHTRKADRALDAMNPGPQTVRPDMTLGLAARLLRTAPYLLVTDPRGRYLGRYYPPAAPLAGKAQNPDA